jgi:hypothetical protein
MPSEQLDAWHVSGEPEQTPLAQSPATRHFLPVPHLPQLAPPQSTSVSTPFLTPSEQVGTAHLSGEPEQTPLWQSPATAHVRPLAHFGQPAPPQSTSVSVPFLTKSVQLAAWQMLPMHTPLWQSEGLPQIFPATHFTQVAPPQSTSDSVPFFTLSLHAAATHLRGDPEHTPLWQSAGTAQPCPVPHLPGQLPPQSTSVSVPFLTLSEQLGAWQMLLTHTPLRQSLADAQDLPAAHLPQLAPPQSTSVSVPFLMRSVHVGAWHLSGLPEHMPLWQSLADAHVAPVPHFGHDAPPQSTSVSVPFLTTSVQVAALHVSGEPEHTPLWQSLPTAHVAPVPHFGQLAPPQSTSVSVPFFTTSVHVGAWQMLPMHTPLAQSAATPQTLPAAHLAHVPPPQSTSVSAPFFTTSAHVGAWHLSGEPVHTPLWQSPATAHVLPVVHFEHVPPPQSTSVSAPFLTTSVQVGAWHTLLTQTPLWQSVPAEQILPVAHVGHPPPPQSTSVSVPFLTTSAHVGAWHLSGEPVHTPLAQSEAPVHVLPVPHFGQDAPPQSTSVSVPFLTTSAHVGAWHTRPVHTPLWQSEPELHALPAAHFGHDAPPQSMSVSVPFLTTSVQLGDWQMLPTHTPLWQSLPPVHCLPATHFGHVDPPQSVSVSVPFFTVSVHVAVWHTRPVHTPLWQSLATRHALPATHFEHAAPPQSMSVSVPFLTRSVQPAAWHTLAVHTPLAQSVGPLHVLPFAHLLHVAPPQSTSVSAPFFTLSVHVGTAHLSGDPEHTPLWQSAGTVHVLPSAHLPQLPPQSTSDSVPFLTTSEQLGA